MAGFNEIFGLLICMAPLLGLIAYLMWASRRPKCAQCRGSVKAGDKVCRHCGHELGEQQSSKKSA